MFLVIHRFGSKLRLYSSSTILSTWAFLAANFCAVFPEVFERRALFIWAKWGLLGKDDRVPPLST